MSQREAAKEAIRKRSAGKAGNSFRGIYRKRDNSSIFRGNAINKEEKFKGFQRVIYKIKNLMKNKEKWVKMNEI